DQQEESPVEGASGLRPPTTPPHQRGPHPRHRAAQQERRSPMGAIPVVILSTTDPVLRDLVEFSAVTGLPRTAVLRQDLDPTAGTLRRVISDEYGIAEQDVLPLAHTCLGCAIREDTLPTLARMTAADRWERVLVSLPLTAETAPLSRPLTDRHTA